MAESQDILALLDSIPWETRNDPSTARKIAELIATKASEKMQASIAFQAQSVEDNEKMFKPQMDQVQQQAQQPPEAAPAGPDIGELI